MKSLLLGSLLGVALLVSGVSYAACNPVLTKPTGIYLVHGNGTVTDNETGLMWEVATSAAITWDVALANSVTAITAAYTDWRLPNSKELASLTDKACSSPAINAVVFPGTVSGNYWTSTPVNNAGSANSAFTVNFANGSLNVTTKNTANNVRLVRAGY